MPIVTGREHRKAQYIHTILNSESHSVNVCQDGIFWMTKDEFFEFFPTVYLCAHDMSNFQLLESGCPPPDSAEDSEDDEATVASNVAAEQHRGLRGSGGLKVELRCGLQHACAK